MSATAKPVGARAAGTAGEAVRWWMRLRSAGRHRPRQRLLCVCVCLFGRSSTRSLLSAWPQAQCRQTQPLSVAARPAGCGPQFCQTALQQTSTPCTPDARPTHTSAGPVLQAKGKGGAGLGGGPSVDLDQQRRQGAGGRRKVLHAPRQRSAEVRPGQRSTPQCVTARHSTARSAAWVRPQRGQSVVPAQQASSAPSQLALVRL